ncbi:MAG: tryptophan synthase subunit alpha [Lachnospiraceae bacterium]|nr:tryptophan synthase subunit alpha [Lachnospiraceae bacterium]
MSKIREAFEGGKAFIPFITCGDPDLETTKKLVLAMAQAGADIIELGIPFSDPTAEGPVIQEANLRALSGGVTTDKIFEMVKELRESVSIPFVFMTYANVVFSYGNTRRSGSEEAGGDNAAIGGTEAFLQKAAEAGVNGLILPDVPFEEKEDFAPACKKYGIELISLVAPTSQERIATVAKEAEGFLYCVSSLGVTGVRSQITTDIGAMVSLVRQASDIPAAIGFGISTPQQAKEMARKADGVIVGSAIVKLIAQHGRDCIPYVTEYVKQMKEAIS